MIYPNLDANFGEAPMMLTIVVNGTKRDIVAAAQKSGYAWALERDNEPTFVLQFAGPGGVAGGGSWGAATDGIKEYNKQHFVTHQRRRQLWSTENPTNLRASGSMIVAMSCLVDLVIQ
ncbi:hypothetical protein FRX31_012177 [Thalictrum thalictroides]|uniref:Uncharacterized protein n=1 Tax=Thalictrum thalictroides TaxID=46969 RepID=A0A7J6WLJ4_THATH|nr:hypothetical protein FRX31_012177 [Thalictrum thalictroides]